MNILHVINDLDPAGGGPPLVASRLAAAQAAQGHTAHMLCYATPAAEQRIARDLAHLPGADHVMVHAMAPVGRAERLAGRRAKAAAAELVPGADFIHLHGTWESILRSVASVARARGKPYALAPHGMLDPWALSQKPLKKKLAMALGYRAMISGAAFLHAMSAYEAQCIGEGGFNDRVEVIPNGIFLGEFEPLPPREAVEKKHPQLKGSPYILFLARLHPVKGLDLLADAFARIWNDFPKVRVIVAGPDFGAGAALREQVGRLGIGARFHMIGPVHGVEKAALYAHAAVFTLPSEHESFGMSIAEAMACRAPVVVTEECHFTDVAEHGTGVVVQRTADALAAGLARVLGDPAAGRAMGECGRRLIESKYTWPRLAEQSLEAYARAAAR